MKKHQLPQDINPFSMADRRAEIRGALEISNMDRLAPFLSKLAGQAEISLNFGRDERGVAYIKGCVKAALLLTCQRCMQAFTVNVDIAVALSPVVDDNQAVALEGDYEPLMVVDQRVSLMGLVEDELILALPTVAMHEPDQCPVKVPEDESDKVLEKGPNPFAVLANKKRD